MPIYEYECGKCGHEFEVLQSASDKAPGSCPKCKARKLRRLISQTSFQLKGTGWYVTDYAGNKSGGKSKVDGDGAESAAKSETKTDSGGEKSPTTEKSPKKGGKKKPAAAAD